MGILDEITNKSYDRVAEIKNSFTYPFKKALASKEISFICEIKKASPSKGVITTDFNHLEIAKEYELAGASAISVLTEPYYFLGKDEYLREVSEESNLPTLRKDFIIDEYQIYEAKLLGASAVLLICRILPTNKLRDYILLAKRLGMSALVEVHSKEEVIKALDAKAEIIGINNRDLETFTVDINTTIKLREWIPSEVLVVSESGIKTREDIETLARYQIAGVLIGETLMRSKDKKKTLYYLRGKMLD